MTSEWSSKYNPFNSDKVLAQLDRWSGIKRGEILPAPGLITVDPTNVCNLSCDWCNSEYLRDRNSSSLTADTMRAVAEFLPRWSDHPRYGGVDAVCVAGGGEPLNNPHTKDFVGYLTEQGIGVGIVTNGTGLERYAGELTDCDWIGVSVDAGRAETYEKLKGKDKLFDVVNGMKALTSRGGNLNGPGKGRGVYYKYLLHPENVGEVEVAAKIAKEAGCRGIHIRPVGTPWFGDKPYVQFSHSDIMEFNEQVEKARELEDKDFGVYGITHKFDGDFRKSNAFRGCMAVFMTADILPNTGEDFSLGLCCDRRGDANLTIGLTDPHQIKDFWGSEEHWTMADQIQVDKCPRCTYQPHNQLFEKAIKEDNMSWRYY